MRELRAIACLQFRKQESLDRCHGGLLCRVGAVLVAVRVLGATVGSLGAWVLVPRLGAVLRGGAWCHGWALDGCFGAVLVAVRGVVGSLGAVLVAWCHGRIFGCFAVRGCCGWTFACCFGCCPGCKGACCYYTVASLGIFGCCFGSRKGGATVGSLGAVWHVFWVEEQ